MKPQTKSKIHSFCFNLSRYNDVTMITMASQITGASIVYWSICSGAYQRKNQGSTSLAFVRGIQRGPVKFPHKGSITQKMFPFDYVIILLTILYSFLPRAPYMHQWTGIASDNDLSPFLNRTHRNKLQWNSNENPIYFIQGNAFEKVVCEMAVILSRGMGNCVRSRSILWLQMPSSCVSRSSAVAIMTMMATEPCEPLSPITKMVNLISNND